MSADLVPLSYLIDRLVTQSYSDFSTLLETLPSHTDQQRKQLLVDYVLHTRRQFLKLLVLTRWSAESDRIRKSINIIGFLSNQNHQLDASIQQLTQAVEGLKGARVRNYDLETSLTVLQKGTYDRLPSAIREAFEGQEKLDDDQVIDTMRECEQVMRWRLKMGKEEIPRVMLDNYRIGSFLGLSIRPPSRRVVLTLPQQRMEGSHSRSRDFGKRVSCIRVQKPRMRRAQNLQTKRRAMQQRRPRLKTNPSGTFSA